VAARRRNYSRYKGREYTPEERKIIERRRRIARARKQYSQNVLIAVVAIMSVAVAGVCVWYFGFVMPYDNYDAQMRIGAEKFKTKHYDEAGKAFMNALSKRPNDPEATVALSDTYAAEGRYEEAIRGMKAIQGIDETDTRTYERLITWYANGTKDIESANGQIISAYEKQLAIENELVRPAPTFSPAPGAFSEMTSVAIRADGGLAIYYSTDGSIPTPASGEKYSKRIRLKNNDGSIYTAVSYNNEGLMSWPAVAQYSMTIKYSVDTTAFGHIGDTARVIMDDVGPLYYDAHHASGYYYYDDDKLFFYVFPDEYFMSNNGTAEGATDGTADGATGGATDGTADGTTGGAVDGATGGAVEGIALDPEREPLPPDAVCSAIAMSVKDYVIGMDGNIQVEDFMIGIGIDEYDIDADEDGGYHLTYSAKGIDYDIYLKNKNTITPEGELIAR
jgi:tetratricopeptide (TPR) repeat protein